MNQFGVKGSMSPKDIFDGLIERVKSPTWQFLLISYFILQIKFISLLLKGPVDYSAVDYYKLLFGSYKSGWGFGFNLITLALILFILFKLSDLLFKLINNISKWASIKLDGVEVIPLAEHQKKIIELNEKTRNQVYDSLRVVENHTKDKNKIIFNVIRSFRSHTLEVNKVATVISDQSFNKLTKFKVSSDEKYSYIIQDLSNALYLCVDLRIDSYVPVDWDLFKAGTISVFVDIDGNLISDKEQKVINFSISKVSNDLGKVEKYPVN